MYILLFWFGKDQIYLFDANSAAFRSRSHFLLYNFAASHTIECLFAVNKHIWVIFKILFLCIFRFYIPIFNIHFLSKVLIHSIELYRLFDHIVRIQFVPYSFVLFKASVGTFSVKKLVNHFPFICIFFRL